MHCASQQLPTLHRVFEGHFSIPNSYPVYIYPPFTASPSAHLQEGFTVAGLDGVLAEYASYTRDQCCAVCKSNPNCAAATSAGKMGGGW